MRTGKIEKKHEKLISIEGCLSDTYRYILYISIYSLKSSYISIIHFAYLYSKNIEIGNKSLAYFYSCSYP